MTPLFLAKNLRLYSSGLKVTRRRFFFCSPFEFYFRFNNIAYQKNMVTGENSARSKVCVQLSQRFDEPHSTEANEDEDAECSSSKKQKIDWLVAVESFGHEILNFYDWHAIIYFCKGTYAFLEGWLMYWWKMSFCSWIPLKLLLVYPLLRLLISCNQHQLCVWIDALQLLCSCHNIL